MTLNHEENTLLDCGAKVVYDFGVCKQKIKKVRRVYFFHFFFGGKKNVYTFAVYYLGRTQKHVQ